MRDTPVNSRFPDVTLIDFHGDDHSSGLYTGQKHLVIVLLRGLW